MILVSPKPVVAPACRSGASTCRGRPALEETEAPTKRSLCFQRGILSSRPDSQGLEPGMGGRGIPGGCSGRIETWPF